MSRQVSALVVNEDVNLLQDLVAILECQEVATQCARSARKRKRRCRSKGSPDIIIFAGTSFADGTWRDVLNLAHKASPRIGVIVTTRLADVHFYLDAMEEGAADYVVPFCVPRRRPRRPLGHPGLQA